MGPDVSEWGGGDVQIKPSRGRPRNSAHSLLTTPKTSMELKLLSRNKTVQEEGPENSAHSLLMTPKHAWS